MFGPCVRIGVVAIVLGVVAPATAQEMPSTSVSLCSTAGTCRQETGKREAIRPSSLRDAADQLVAPSAAVAVAWASEASEREALSAGSSKSLTALYASHGVLQGLDVYSTLAARRNGAREVNPIMNGSHIRNTIVKSVASAGTLAAVKAIQKRNKTAAVMTMVAVNAVTAVVVANNLRNARRLR